MTDLSTKLFYEDVNFSFTIDKKKLSDFIVFAERAGNDNCNLFFDIKMDIISDQINTEITLSNFKLNTVKCKDGDFWKAICRFRTDLKKDLYRFKFEPDCTTRAPGFVPKQQSVPIFGSSDTMSFNTEWVLEHICGLEQ